MAGLALLGLAIAAGREARAQGSAQEPVLIRKSTAGGVAHVAGALGWSRVKGLKAEGEGFLAVRDGADESFAAHDRLTNGRLVFAVARKGVWRGIVYTSPIADFDAALSQCGLDEAVAKTLERPRAYGGPCHWGWVHGGWLEPVAD